MRNKKVTTAMKKKYKDLCPSDSRPLSLSFISNAYYIKHKVGYTEDDELPFSLDTTGVPGLRLAILRLPAASKLNILRTHCHVIVPGLLNAMENWSDKSAVVRREELRTIFTKPGENAEDIIVGYIQKMKSSLDTIILKKISK